MLYPFFFSIHTYSIFSKMHFYYVTLPNAVTPFDFGLIPGLLWWVIKCLIHLERLLYLWIDYLPSAAQLLNVTACWGAEDSSKQEEICHFFPSRPPERFMESYFGECSICCPFFFFFFPSCHLIVQDSEMD